MNTVSIIKNNKGFVITFREKPFDAEYIDFKVADNVVYFVPGLKVWGNKMETDKFGNCKFFTQANLFGKFAVKDRYIVKQPEDGMGCYIEKGKYGTVPDTTTEWVGRNKKGGGSPSVPNGGLKISYTENKHKSVMFLFSNRYAEFVGKRLQYRISGDNLYLKIDDDACGWLIGKAGYMIRTNLMGENAEILKPLCGRYELIEDGNGVYHIKQAEV